MQRFFSWWAGTPPKEGERKEKNERNEIRYGDYVRISVSGNTPLSFAVCATEGGDIRASHSVGSIFRVCDTSNTILHSGEGFFLETEHGDPILLNMKNGSLVWRTDFCQDQAVRVKFAIHAPSSLAYYNTKCSLGIQAREPLIVSFSPVTFFSTTFWRSYKIPEDRLQYFVFEKVSTNKTG